MEYHVDVDHSGASEDNPGTADEPLPSIASAVERLEPGDVVTIAGGVYRETILVTSGGTAEAPVTISAAPGQTVVCSGADVVTGWERIPDADGRPIWKKSPWPAWAEYGEQTGGKDAKPQLIVDGGMLLHVGLLEEIMPGSFCYDAADGGAILVWPRPPRRAKPVLEEGKEWFDNPADLASDDLNGCLVEAAVRPKGIFVEDGVTHVRIRGIVVRYGSGGYPAGTGIEIGPEQGWVSDVVLEDCAVEFHMGGSVSLRGRNITARRCYFRHNGISSGAIVADSLIEDCVFDGNSSRGVSHSWSAGGIKLLHTVNTTVRRCQFINNDGPGIWFDWGNSDNVVEQNVCSHNYGPGIMMEVSPHFDSEAPDAKMVIHDDTARRLGLPEDTPAGANIVRNNICIANRSDSFLGSGIVLQLASNTIVVNNTVIGNEMFGIFVRYHPYHDLKHRCAANVIMNNIAVDNGGSQLEITPVPADKPSGVSGNESDFNLMWDEKQWRKPAHLSLIAKPAWPNRAEFERWGKVMFNGTFSVEEWSRISGQDKNSIQADPMLVSPRTGDCRLLPGSPARSMGRPTPHVTVDFLGRLRPTDCPPSIGALEYDDAPKVPPRAMAD